MTIISYLVIWKTGRKKYRDLYSVNPIYNFSAVNDLFPGYKKIWNFVNPYRWVYNYYHQRLFKLSFRHMTKFKLIRLNWLVLKYFTFFCDKKRVKWSFGSLCPKEQFFTQKVSFFLVDGRGVCLHRKTQKSVRKLTFWSKTPRRSVCTREILVVLCCYLLLLISYCSFYDSLLKAALLSSLNRF